MLYTLVWIWVTNRYISKGGLECLWFPFLFFFFFFFFLKKKIFWGGGGKDFALIFFLHIPLLFSLFPLFSLIHRHGHGQKAKAKAKVNIPPGSEILPLEPFVLLIQNLPSERLRECAFDASFGFGLSLRFPNSQNNTSPTTLHRLDLSFRPLHPPEPLWQFTSIEIFPPRRRHAAERAAGMVSYIPGRDAAAAAAAILTSGRASGYRRRRWEMGLGLCGSVA